MTMGISEIIFFLVGAVAIASAFGVILHPHPVYSALSLVVALFQIAVLFILLDAQMVAFLQVLVYAGAIMVLFLFVIMLLNLGRDPEVAPIGWKLTALGAGGLLGVELGWFFLRRVVPPSAAGAIDPDFGSVRALAHALFTDHALSFEITSILLLVAMVGAVVLARRGAD
jgi:NADH-quinone oxidoreductase subunit J